jgi:Uma2 family endonuclease
MTPDELLRMPDGKGYELVDGIPVEHNLGLLGSWVAGQLAWHVGKHCTARRLGYVFGSAQYFCFPNRPSLIRKPDVSFIRYGRFPDDRLPRAYCTIPPDLAAEVVSPWELAESLMDKVGNYLAVGVRLVWVVYPATRTITVYRPDRTGCWLSDEQDLCGEVVLPEFRCRVANLFPPDPPEEITSPDAPILISDSCASPS